MRTALFSRTRGACLCVACFFASAAGCSRVEPARTKFGGTWTMNLGARTFLVLMLRENSGTITGTLARPEHFQTSNVGFHFTQISAATVREPVVDASVQNGRLHLVTVSPKDKHDTSAYDLTLTGKDEATLKLADAPFDPWLVRRIPVGDQASVSTDWEPARSYSQEEGKAPSAEMQRIFDADQKGRQDFASLSPEQRGALGAQDAERRDQTRSLLAAGRLHTGEDFKRAAFVFQHGDKPDDYLLAHTLAMVAVANGDADAIWIGAATLDRYLQAVGKPQIYGTQFKFDSNQTTTQEPYDRALVSDALRRQLDVPAQAVQVEQFKHLMADSRPSAAAKAK